MKEIHRLTIENLNDKAYIEIRNKIITGELKPGTRLVDSQLAERYGISRTPVRDAIRKLTEEGLVVSNIKKGYYVFEVTKKDIVEIFEIRLIIDRAVITKLITAIIPSNYEFYIKELQRIEQKLDEGIKQSANEFIKYDEDFHDSLIRLSNNSRLINMYTDIRIQTKAFRSLTSLSEERIEKAYRSHKEILKNIENMDLENALKAIENHVEQSRKDALEDFDNNSDD